MLSPDIYLPSPVFILLKVFFSFLLISYCEIRGKIQCLFLHTQAQQHLLKHIREGCEKLGKLW